MDPDFPTGAELDAMTFEERDAIEQEQADGLRELLTGLPARPGTRR